MSRHGSSKAASHGLATGVPKASNLPFWRGCFLGGSTAGPPKNPEICKKNKPGKNHVDSIVL